MRYAVSPRSRSTVVFSSPWLLLTSRTIGLSSGRGMRAFGPDRRRPKKSLNYNTFTLMNFFVFKLSLTFELLKLTLTCVTKINSFFKQKKQNVVLVGCYPTQPDLILVLPVHMFWTKKTRSIWQAMCVFFQFNGSVNAVGGLLITCIQIDDRQIDNQNLQIDNLEIDNLQITFIL